MKKALVVLSAIFILISLVISMTVFTSAATVHSGTFSGSLTWKFNETTGELTISGEGDIMNFPSHSVSEWDKYGSKIKSVKIEEGVTSIGDYSFSFCKSLTSVTIPSTVERIGVCAFYSCTSLKNITIPSSVSEIDVSSFSYCNKLIQVENGVSYVDKWAVACNSSVQSVALRQDTVGIAASAFKDCSRLTRVTIPSSVMTVCKDAFDGCNGLFEVENGVYYVDKWAVKFRLNTVNYVSVVLREDTVGIGNHIFYDRSVLQGITIPKGVKSIGNYAFCDCRYLTSIAIPDTVESIGRYAFSNCIGLERITLSNGLTTIKEGAIYRCRNLESLTIPSSVTHVGKNAFRDCRALTKVTFDQNSQLTTIGNAAFGSCTALTTVVLPSGLTSISDMLFSSCTALTTVTIPNSVTQIEELAFYQSGVKTIIIPDGVTSIDREAFLNCKSLASITIPTSVKTIGKSALSGCTNLTKIVYLGTVGEWRTISRLADWDKNTGNYELEVHTHDYEAIITPPTCTEQGYTLHTCKNCGDSYKDMYSDALEHIYDDDQDKNCNNCNALREILSTEEPENTDTSSSNNKGCQGTLANEFAIAIILLAAVVFPKKTKRD